MELQKPAPAWKGGSCYLLKISHARSDPSAVRSPSTRLRAGRVRRPRSRSPRCCMMGALYGESYDCQGLGDDRWAVLRRERTNLQSFHVGFIDGMGDVHEEGVRDGVLRFAVACDSVSRYRPSCIRRALPLVPCDERGEGPVFPQGRRSGVEYEGGGFSVRATRERAESHHVPIDVEQVP